MRLIQQLRIGEVSIRNIDEISRGLQNGRIEQLIIGFPEPALITPSSYISLICRIINMKAGESNLALRAAASTNWL